MSVLLNKLRSLPPECRIALASAVWLAVFGGFFPRFLEMPWLAALAPVAVVPLALVAWNRDPRRTYGLRVGLTVGYAVVVLGASLINLMVAREQVDTVKYVHDGAVQTEDAVEFLLDGVNPYAADYSQSAFGGFDNAFPGGRPNPPDTHYIYLPFHILASVPFSAALRAWTGWYDQRIVYILAELLAVAFLVRLARGSEWRLLIATVFLFNPFWSKFFVLGFNDIFVFALLAGCLWAVQRGRWVQAGVWFGLAAASKQHAWLVVPFLLLYIILEARRLRRDWRPAVLAALGTAAVFLIPFIAWGPQDFLDDTFRYASGSLVTSYPITGFGIAPQLVDIGVIRSIWDYYPFWIFQLAAGLPLLIILLFIQRQRNTLPWVLVSTILFGFTFWFFSRFFQWNYITFLSFLGIAALALAGPPAWLTKSYAREHHPADL